MQYDFRQQRGIRDAIAFFKIIIQRALAVDHKYMLKVLQAYGRPIDKENLQIIKNIIFLAGGEHKDWKWYN